jgi:hypothetical protein
MAVTLHYLVGYRRGIYPQFTAGFLFHFRRNRGVGADGSRYFPDRNYVLRFVETVLIPPHFIHPYRQLQAERGRLGMYAVRPAHLEGIFMFDCPLRQRGRKLLDVFNQDIGCFDELEAGGRIDDVRRGKPQMDEA